MQVRRVHRLSASLDLVVRFLADKTYGQARFKRLWMLAGGPRDQLPTWGHRDPMVAIGGDSPKLTATKRPGDWREEEYKRWAGAPVQGVGVKHFKGCKISNHWLRDPSLWGIKSTDFSAALRARANVVPVREALSRGKRDTLKRCRRCGFHSESLHHMISACRMLSNSRCARHNKICGILAKRAELNHWRVASERPI